MPPETATQFPAGKVDNKTEEYADLSDAQVRALRRCRDAKEISVEFCRPYFDKFIRFLNLYHGKLPDELDSTFSKVMLWHAFSIVQNEIPRSAATLFSEKDFFHLEATSPEQEFTIQSARHWLNYVARKQNRIFPRIIPTLQRVGVFGTGLRVVSHNVKQKGSRNDDETLNITAQNVDIFSMLPSPTGGLVNAPTEYEEAALPWLIWTDYMSIQKAKRLANAARIDRRQAAKMLEKQGHNWDDDTNAIDLEYKAKAAESLNDGNTQGGAPDWLKKIRNTYPHVDNHFRCEWFWFRDRWYLIGENRYVLKIVSPQLDWIPAAKYVDTPDFDDFYGIGMVETAEDILLAFLLNFGFRLDYLANTLHPQKFVSDKLAKVNPGEDFDPTPNGYFTVPANIRNINEAIWYDRFPEISPQAFMEESSFRQLLQEITAQPNYMKGMGGSGTLANETATGIVSLIEEGTARSTMRSLTVEHTGLQDELRLYLKYGDKYVWDDQLIRNDLGDDDGYPWTLIPNEDITDSYDIELRGTQALAHKNTMVKQMLTSLQFIHGNPNIPPAGQLEALRQYMRESGGWSDVEKIIGQGGAGAGLLAAPGQGLQGAPTLQNEIQATNGALPQAAAQVGGRIGQATSAFSV